MARLVGQKEVVQGWLYDSIHFEAGTTYTSVTLFQQPMGQAGKTLLDTNVETAGQLAGINALTITSMMVKVEDLVKPANFNNALMGVMALVIGQKPYPDWAPIWLYQGGPSFRVAVYGANVEYALGGDASIRNTLKFSRAFYVTIRPGETFRVELRWPDGFTPDGESFRLWVFLFGLRERAVQ